MNITRRTIQALGLVLVLVGLDLPLRASDWRIGDVFVAVGNGQYKVYDNAGVFKETITDSQGNGFTAGCAIDSTFHLYTTNFSNTKVVRYAIIPPHIVLQTIDTGVTSPGGHSESIVFDGIGNFYVGHPDGNHLVHKYNVAGVLERTYAVAIEVGGRGSDWIELASDQKTLFYTSEGRIIRRFDVSGEGTQLSDFGNLGELSGKLFALRLLPPGDGSGGLLVAGRDHIRRFGASGSVIQSYTAPGENFWFALNLDPNGTSFWAGDLGTGHVYRFNIASGAIEVGPISTGAFEGALGGICAYGGFGAAQPASTIQTLSLTPANITGTVRNDNNSNALTLTLNGLSQNANVTVRFSLIDPSSGTSETGLPCIIVSSDGTKCAVHQIEADTTAYTSAHLYHGWMLKGTQNPRMFRNGSEDVTTAQYIDPGDDGDVPTLSTYTDQEAPLSPGAINCGFFAPVADGAVFHLGRTIPVRFEATTGTCDNGPFITDDSGAQPRLSLAKVAPGFPPVPQTVKPAGGSDQANLFRLSEGRTWIYNWSTDNLTAGDYIVTAFDLANQIPPASVRITLQ
jgi:hypothetical protein